MAWVVWFYEEGDGSKPVEEFLDTLSVAERAKVFQVINLLQEKGPGLPFPWSSQVEGKLRELRAHYGNNLIRVFYYFDAVRSAKLLHGVRKSAEKLDPQDIGRARVRMEGDIARLPRRKR